MLSEDELGAELAKRLREFVSDVEPSRELIISVDRKVRAARANKGVELSPRLRDRLMAVSVPVDGAVVVAIVALSGSGAAPAFAVTRGSDGTIREVAGVTGANARLRELDVPVTVVPMSAGCKNHIDLTYMAIGTKHETSIRVLPAEIPPDTTVLLAAEQIPAGRIEMAVGRVTGQAPSCVAPGTTGPGLPSSTTPMSRPVPAPKGAATRS